MDGRQDWGSVMSREVEDSSEDLGADDRWRKCAWEEDEDARSTAVSSSGSGTGMDGWQTPSCADSSVSCTGSGKTLAAYLQGALEGLDSERSSVSSDRMSEQRRCKAAATSGCATPAHLWPSTPEPSPPQSPRMMPLQGSWWHPAAYQVCL